MAGSSRRGSVPVCCMLSGSACLVGFCQGVRRLSAVCVRRLVDQSGNGSRVWFLCMVPAVKAEPSGCMGYADAADGHPATFRQMTSGCGRWDGGNPADGGGRWSDGKRRSARKNPSKHATHSKKKILKKNDADLKLSIFQTGDF